MPLVSLNINASTSHLKPTTLVFVERWSVALQEALKFRSLAHGRKALKSQERLEEAFVDVSSIAVITALLGVHP